MDPLVRDGVAAAWVHRASPPTVLITAVVVGVLFHTLAGEANRKQLVIEMPWFDLYCGIALAAWIFAGVMTLVWTVPEITVTPLPVGGFTIATGTIGCFESGLVGAFWFGGHRWLAYHGWHRWQRERHASRR